MSRPKSICTEIGGGNLLSSTSAARAEPARQTARTLAPHADGRRSCRRAWPSHARLVALSLMTHHASRFTFHASPQYRSRTSTFDPCTAVWHPDDQQEPMRIKVVWSLWPM